MAYLSEIVVMIKSTGPSNSFASIAFDHDGPDRSQPVLRAHATPDMHHLVAAEMTPGRYHPNRCTLTWDVDEIGLAMLTIPSSYTGLVTFRVASVDIESLTISGARFGTQVKHRPIAVVVHAWKAAVDVHDLAVHSLSIELPNRITHAPHLMPSTRLDEKEESLSAALLVRNVKAREITIKSLAEDATGVVNCQCHLLDIKSSGRSSTSQIYLRDSLITDQLIIETSGSYTSIDQTKVKLEQIMDLPTPFRTHSHVTIRSTSRHAGLTISDATFHRPINITCHGFVDFQKVNCDEDLTLTHSDEPDSETSGLRVHSKDRPPVLVSFNNARMHSMTVSAQSANVRLEKTAVEGICTISTVGGTIEIFDFTAGRDGPLHPISSAHFSTVSGNLLVNHQSFDPTANHDLTAGRGLSTNLLTRFSSDSGAVRLYSLRSSAPLKIQLHGENHDVQHASSLQLRHSDLASLQIETATQDVYIAQTTIQGVVKIVTGLSGSSAVHGNVMAWLDLVGSDHKHVHIESLQGSANVVYRGWTDDIKVRSTILSRYEGAVHGIPLSARPVLLVSPSFSGCSFAVTHTSKKTFRTASHCPTPFRTVTRLSFPHFVPVEELRLSWNICLSRSVTQNQSHRALDPPLAYPSALRTPFMSVARMTAALKEIIVVIRGQGFATLALGADLPATGSPSLQSHWSHDPVESTPPRGRSAIYTISWLVTNDETREDIDNTSVASLHLPSSFDGTLTVRIASEDITALTLSDLLDRTRNINLSVSAHKAAIEVRLLKLLRDLSVDLPNTTASRAHAIPDLTDADRRPIYASILVHKVTASTVKINSLVRQPMAVVDSRCNSLLVTSHETRSADEDSPSTVYLLSLTVEGLLNVATHENNVWIQHLRAFSPPGAVFFSDDVQPDETKTLSVHSQNGRIDLLNAHSNKPIIFLSRQRVKVHDSHCKAGVTMEPIVNRLDDKRSDTVAITDSNLDLLHVKTKGRDVQVSNWVIGGDCNIQTGQLGRITVSGLLVHHPLPHTSPAGGVTLCTHSGTIAVDGSYDAGFGLQTTPVYGTGLSSNLPVRITSFLGTACVEAFVSRAPLEVRLANTTINDEEGDNKQHRVFQLRHSDLTALHVGTAAQDVCIESTMLQHTAKIMTGTGMQYGATCGHVEAQLILSKESHGIKVHVECKRGGADIQFVDWQDGMNVTSMALARDGKVRGVPASALPFARPVCLFSSYF